mmetsp:Transcript_37620/g.82388  ORF Transcript_37620/g.82388 Transcript_37620/m.82388 type:complete len:312 (-) Transcript_37620:162-1097(-)
MPTLRCPTCFSRFPPGTSEETLTEHVMHCSARRRVSSDGTTTAAATTSTPQVASSAKKHGLVMDYVDVPRKKKITKKSRGSKGSKVQSKEYDRKEAIGMSTSDTSAGGRTTSPCMSVGEGDVAAGLKSVVGFAAGSKMSSAASERYESGKEAEQGHDLRQIDARYECPVCLKLFSRAITPFDEIQSHVVQCTDLNESVGDDAKLSAEIAAMAAAATNKSKVIARKEKASGTEAKGKVATKRRSKPSQTKAARKARTKKKCSYRRVHTGYGGTAVSRPSERLNRARDIQSLSSGGPYFALKTMVLSELDSFY